MGKQGQAIKEQCRTTQDGIKKAKTGLELVAGDDGKSNRKGFYKYISSERRTKKIPLLNSLEMCLKLCNVECSMS